MNPNIKIVQGDAITLLEKMDGASVDLIIADPPYNLGKDYGNTSDSQNYNDYIIFSKNWIKQANRVLKPNGTMYVFMGVRFISYIYHILEQESNMQFNSWISWHYTQGIGKTKGFSPRHDDILMFTKSDKFTFNLDDVRVPQKFYRERNNMRGANPGDVWQFSHVHYSHPNRQNHPTQKPEGLIERMVLASSNKDDVVLDPFSGSGTTLRVCQQLGRKCIGFELNEEYIELTKNRLNIPFTGFDSVDPRMKRIPYDLRDSQLRSKYIQNHIEWFLKNHEDNLDEFLEMVNKVYSVKGVVRNLDLLEESEDMQEAS